MKQKNDTLMTKKDMFDVLAEFWEQVISPALDKKPDKTDIAKLRSELKKDIRNVDRKITDLQIDTPTIKQHQHLEKRVEKLESTHQN